VSAAELHRFGFKVFAETAPAPAALIPVFHRWIRESVVPGLLIDVADYSHLPMSPGVVLVGHEADYALDATEGPAGLLLLRKADQEGSVEERLAAVLKAALDAAEKLEKDPELGGKLRFKKGAALFVANDRLRAPNEESAFKALQTPLEAAAKKVLGPKAKVVREAGDSRRRLAATLSI
jgi:hypothetical protein